MRKISQMEGFLFDLDGSIYAGQSLLPGAYELLEYLSMNNKEFVFITNNSLNDASFIVRKLQSMGIKVCLDQIISPVGLAGEYLYERFGFCNVFVIGSDELKKSVQLFGHTLCNNLCCSCNVVLVGRDLEFDYKKLEKSVILLQSGSKLVATNLDGYHPIENGVFVPETGAFIASIQEVVNITPEVIGKPSSFIFNKAIEKIGLKREILAIVGDNPYTDIMGGYTSGLYTIWLKNDTHYSDHEAKADLIVRSLENFVSILRA